jgi:hypothetical protein
MMIHHHADQLMPPFPRLALVHEELNTLPLMDIDEEDVTAK